MKFITMLLTFMVSTQAFAHTDHALGEGNFHALYHGAFWLIFAAVVVKAVSWYSAKSKKNKMGDKK